MAEVQPPVEQPVATDVVREQDKIMLVLAYFGIFGLIPFLTVKDSPYVRWHARQGLVLLGAEVVVEIGLAVLGMVMGMIVHVFAPLFGCLSALVALAYIAVAILGMVKAVGGQRWKVPVVGDLAEKMNF